MNDIYINITEVWNVENVSNIEMSISIDNTNDID